MVRLVSKWHNMENHPANILCEFVFSCYSENDFVGCDVLLYEYYLYYTVISQNIESEFKFWLKW